MWFGDAPVMCGMRQADYGQVSIQRIRPGLACGLCAMLRLQESFTGEVFLEGGQAFLQKRFFQVSLELYLFVVCIIYTRSRRNHSVKSTFH